MPSKQIKKPIAIAESRYHTQVPKELGHYIRSHMQYDEQRRCHLTQLVMTQDGMAMMASGDQFVLINEANENKNKTMWFGPLPKAMFSDCFVE